MVVPPKAGLAACSATYIPVHNLPWAMQGASAMAHDAIGLLLKEVYTRFCCATCVTVRFSIYLNRMALMAHVEKQRDDDSLGWK